MRLDKLLHYLRFAKTRGAAQRWIGEAHIRRNGARVMRQDLAVAPGDILTLPLANRVLVIELVALPRRRGPASEAQACYRALDGGAAKAIGGAEGPSEGI
ncbi:MAG: S4 domain-containing protein [Croceibacterium sp.]